MAVITNYTTLVENVIALLENDDTEFSAYIPTALALAEERLVRENDFSDLETKTTAAVTANNPLITKPSGVNYVKYLNITVAGDKRILLKKTDDFIIDYWPNSTNTGVPKYYADESETQYLLAPTPDSAYTYEIKYVKAPGKLSTTNATNYFVSNCPDMLFKATIVEMVKFMKAWNQIQIFEADYQAARESWNLEQAMKRRDDTSTPQNPEGSQNTLKSTVQTTS